MENKNIDKLFRNKLKDLKVSAPNDAWNAIAEKLPRKKKRRALVLWWSAAAVLLALFGSSVFYWSVSEKVPQNIQVVESENTSDIPSQKSYVNTTIEEDSTSEIIDSTQQQDDTLIENEYRNSSEFDTSKNKALADKSVKGKAIASKETKEGKLGSNTSSKQSITHKQKVKKEEGYSNYEALLSKQIRLENETKDKNQASKEQIAEIERLNKEEEKIEEVQEVTSLLDNNTFLAIEEDKQDKAKEKQGKWSVGPQVAPVYYNSISSGSSLDNQFNNNGKEGGVNMSLGMQVAYQLNDKWQVRSGVHRMNVGYGTNNVQVGYSDPNLAISNIDYNNVPNGDIVITAFSNENISTIRASQLGNKIEVLNIEGNTQLKQNITYLEVPLEIERKIIQSDFEWTIIGGVSSLFLTNNDVYVHNEDYSHHIGSASNLEKTSFTTNIGMGFGYNFTKSLHLKLEPMFKYQLNAYTNSVDFKPYIFGVYTGINWKLD